MKKDAVKQLLETVKLHQQKLMEKAWCFQSYPEREARLEAIRELSVEWVKIQAIQPFATATCGGVIEDIIQGEWDRALEDLDVLQVHFEDPELKARYEHLWTRFIALTQAFCA